jgi:hypothetical protein
MKVISRSSKHSRRILEIVWDMRVQIKYLEFKKKILELSNHYTKAAQFRRPDIISSGKIKPTKIARLFHRPTQPMKLELIFIGPAQADKKGFIFSSARPWPTKQRVHFRRPALGRRKYRCPNSAIWMSF